MPRRDVGLRAELSELVAMLRAYAVQETVGPLRGLGRYLLFGLLGSVAVSIAVVLAALALVRVLQTETSIFGANWSFVPHLAGAAALVVAVVALARAMKPRRGDAGDTRHSNAGGINVSRTDAGESVDGNSGDGKSVDGKVERADG